MLHCQLPRYWHQNLCATPNVLKDACTDKLPPNVQDILPQPSLRSLLTVLLVAPTSVRLSPPCVPAAGTSLPQTVRSVRLDMYVRVLGLEDLKLR